MKYIFIFLLSFVYVIQAQAVLSVTKQPAGQMPNNQPLFPAPENVKPNIKSNIQYQENPPVKNIENNSLKSNTASEDSKVQKEENSSLVSTENTVKQKKFSWFFWLGGVFLFGLASWYFWKKDV